MIPAEAVEAVAAELYKSHDLNRYADWDDASSDSRDMWRATAWRVLGVTVPGLLASAWDAGLAKGGDVAAWAIGHRPEDERPDTSNPYRTTT